VVEDEVMVSCEADLRGLQHDSLDLIEGDLVVAAII